MADAGAGLRLHRPVDATAEPGLPARVPLPDAIGRAGAINAALLASAMLALHDEALAQRLDQWRQDQTDGIAEEPST